MARARLPSPPNRLVPPITIAAIVSSSQPAPPSGTPLDERTTSTTPVSPASRPDAVKTQILMRVTPTPASRAVVSLPPIA